MVKSRMLSFAAMLILTQGDTGGAFPLPELVRLPCQRKDRQGKEQIVPMSEPCDRSSRFQGYLPRSRRKSVLNLRKSWRRSRMCVLKQNSRSTGLLLNRKNAE
jgi:hypothetical protein